MTFQLLLFEGLDRTSASISAILLATAPVMTAGWLVARGRLHMRGRGWLGLGLGLTGVILVVGADGTRLTESSLMGNVIALAAAAAWAWYGLVIGSVARSVGPLSATASTLALSAVVLTPLGLGEMVSFDWSSVSIAGWTGILYGSIPGLVIATALWVQAIQRWGTQPTMNYGYVEPVAAVMIAAVVLGETLHPLQGLGAVLALAGVYLASEIAAGDASNST